MKKRITAALLSAVMLFSSFPYNVYAEVDESKIMIHNAQIVERHRGWNAYIVYTVNGVTYDSRYTNPALNRDAYEAFSKEDKDSIAGYFWEVNNKRRQFGTDGAEAVSAHAKNNEEMKKIAENYLKIIEAKMGYLTTDGTTLYSKFGGVDNDENYYYDQTLSDLMVFDYGSDAQIILSDPTYLQTEQGKIFAQKYIDM